MAEGRRIRARQRAFMSRTTDALRRTIAQPRCGDKEMVAITPPESVEPVCE